MSAIPADIESLEDYERHAAGRLPEGTWRHIQEGSGRGLTLTANRAAFDRIGLLPRPLADLRGGSTEVELFGQRHAAPILLAPIAYQKLAHPDGELAVARAAAAIGIAPVLSTLSSVPMEEVATAMHAAASALARPVPPLWFQLYLQQDRAHSLALVRRAEAAGYGVLVVTVDAAMKRAGFSLPPGVEAANLRGLATPVQQQSTPGGAILFGTPLADGAPRWDDIAWLRDQTRLPLVVKGIMAPEDARAAVGHGVDGLILSNHGGRVLDGMPSPLNLLEPVAQATGGAVPLLMDGGVRSGTDVVKALALGARAVLVGRPQMHALAVAGMAGVAHMLHLLRGETELAMAQLGCPTVADITRDRLWPALRCD